MFNIIVVATLLLSVVLLTLGIFRFQASCHANNLAVAGPNTLSLKADRRVLSYKKWMRRITILEIVLCLLGVAIAYFQQ